MYNLIQKYFVLSMVETSLDSRNFIITLYDSTPVIWKKLKWSDLFVHIQLTIVTGAIAIFPSACIEPSF